MKKQKMFSIMAACEASIVEAMAEKISSKYPVTIIKKPSKTLTMIKMREPVQRSLFYLGEVMVTETIVEMQGIKGMAVTMGEDFDKVLAMAIVDCGFNNAFPEMASIEAELEVQYIQQTNRKEKENALHLKTMVNFDSMSVEEMS